MKRLLASIFLMFLVFHGYAQIAIVDDEKAQADIVISKYADSETLKAATELQKYITTISGVTPLITTRKTPGLNHVYIGKDFLSSKNKELLSDSLMEDAFVILAKRNKLYLAGKYPKGDLYAVYTLLEKYLGCMKFSVGEEYIPERDSVVLSVYEEVYNPAFSFRVPHFAGRWDEEYRNWHKINSFNDWGMFVHTFHRLVPSEKYFDEHPEYFAFVNGRRLQDGQLCLSNPDLIATLVENLDLEMLKSPDKHIWSVSQNDCYNYCECEDCQAAYDEYGSISGLYISMANELAMTFPDKVISTLAYQFTRSAPENIKPLPNVNIMFCSIECNRSMPLADDPRSKGFVKDMKDWDNISDNIFMWDYVVQFKNYLTPFPNFHVLQPNIKFFRENGADMMFQQGSGRSWSDLSNLKQYLIVKLLWDPDLNVDSTVNRFLQMYYGKAAPYIRQYFDLTHNAIIEKQHQQNLDIYGFPVFYYDAHLTPELLIRYQQLMDIAERAVASDSISLKRVLRTRIPIDFAVLDIALNRDNEKIRWIHTENGSKLIDSVMLKKLYRFVALCELTGIKNINERSFTPAAYRDFTLRKLNWQVLDNKLEGAAINCLTEYSEKYPVGGEKAITDGLLGGLDFRFNWLGFEGEDMVFWIDLGEEIEFSKLQMNFLKAVNSWVFLPTSVKLEIMDDYDGVTTIAEMKGDNTDRSYLVKSIPFIMEFDKTRARYLRVTATSMKTCPEWHRGFGNPSWIFVDEVILQ